MISDYTIKKLYNMLARSIYAIQRFMCAVWSAFFFFFFLLLQTYGHVMPWRRGIEELKEDRKARNREE